MKDEDEQAQNMEAKQQNITDEACDALKTTAVSAKVKNKKRADFVGINMEGPFISPVKKVHRTNVTLFHVMKRLLRNF